MISYNIIYVYIWTYVCLYLISNNASHMNVFAYISYDLSCFRCAKLIWQNAMYCSEFVQWIYSFQQYMTRSHIIYIAVSRSYILYVSVIHNAFILYHSILWNKWFEDKANLVWKSKYSNVLWLWIMFISRSYKPIEIQEITRNPPNPAHLVFV